MLDSTASGGIEQGMTGHVELNRYGVGNLSGDFNPAAHKNLRFQTESTSGNDRLKVTRAKSTLYGLEGDDLMIGITGVNSVLFGNDGNDQIQGGDLRDVINGGSGNDDLIGNGGNDLLVGGSNNDRITGDQGNDSLRGESGNDQLDGGEGADDLDGGAGFDRLKGGAGNDQLNDYDGGDRLTGGQGADQFGLGSPFATSVSSITDFQPGVDQIKILRSGAAFRDLTFEARRDGTALLDQGKLIALLSGIKLSSLKPTSFIFGDAQRARSLQANLDQFLSVNLATTALSSAVFNPDGTLWLGAAGVSDRQSQTPVDTNSLFGIGSITKPMVATTILQLQQEGKLSLTNTLSQWLPDFASQIPNSDRITIRQLLNHTSGIRNYTDEPALGEAFTSNPAILSQKFTTQELLSLIANQPAVLEPGQAFSYSNSNYLLLGEIIEKATGTTLAVQLRQRIFEPLGMSQTFLASQEAVQGRLTQSYIDLNGDGQLDSLNEGLSWAGAAGAVVSTAADLAKFSQALFQGELLAPDSLQAMVNDTVSISSGPGDLRYGLGIVSGTAPDLGKVQGHDGATVGWQSEMAYLPNRHITAATLASSLAGSADIQGLNLANLKIVAR